LAIPLLRLVIATHLSGAISRYVFSRVGSDVTDQGAVMPELFDLQYWPFGIQRFGASFLNLKE